MPEAGKKSKEKLSRRERRRVAVWMIAAVVLLAAAAATWFFRDRFGTDGLSLTKSPETTAAGGFSYDSGSDQAFASAGQGLAVVTASGFELLNADGTVAASRVMGLDCPTVAACADYAVFYDLGGTSCVIADASGETTDLSVSGGILSVTVSEDGYLAVAAQQTGYRALVTVYSPKHEAIYEWYSASAWVMSAYVSPDSRSLAVLSYTSSGSKIIFLSLTSGTELASFAASGTVLLGMRWISSGSLVAYSTEQALFFDADGSWSGTYSFGGQYLTGCSLDGDGFAAFAVSQYPSGTSGTLLTLNQDGSVRGTAELKSELLSISASGNELLVLCSGGANLYSASLSQKGSLSDVAGYKCALLRDHESALLLASDYAEVYKF